MRPRTLQTLRCSKSNLRSGPSCINPSRMRSTQRLSALRAMRRSLAPLSRLFAAENGNVTPARKRNVGKIVSMKWSPSHGTWPNVSWKPCTPNNVASATTSPSPPMMKNMSKPRTASRDARRPEPFMSVMALISPRNFIYMMIASPVQISQGLVGQATLQARTSS